MKIKLIFGCLNCDKPIPIRLAKTGIQVCSMKCALELHKQSNGKFIIQENEVWHKTLY
jgi:hypothetical protein